MSGRVLTGWGLCLATDGEVVVAQRVPEAGDLWLFYTVKPFLSKDEADTIAARLCVRRDGRWLLSAATLPADLVGDRADWQAAFRLSMDPGKLARLFGEAVTREAEKIRAGIGRGQA